MANLVGIYRALCDGLNIDNGALRAQLAKAESLLGQACDCLDELCDRHQNQVESIDLLQERAQLARVENLDLERRNRDLCGRLATTEERVDDLQRAIDSREEIVASLQHLNDELRTEKDMAFMDGFESGKEQERSAFLKEVDELNVKLDAETYRSYLAEMKLDDTAEENNELRTKNDELAGDLGRVNTYAGGLEKQNEAVRAENFTLHTEGVALRSKLKQLEHHFNEWAKAIHGVPPVPYRLDVPGLTRGVLELQAENEVLRAKLDEFEPRTKHSPEYCKICGGSPCKRPVPSASDGPWRGIGLMPQD